MSIGIRPHCRVAAKGARSHPPRLASGVWPTLPMVGQVGVIVVEAVVVIICPTTTRPSLAPRLAPSVDIPKQSTADCTPCLIPHIITPPTIHSRRPTSFLPLRLSPIIQCPPKYCDFSSLAVLIVHCICTAINKNSFYY